MKIKVNRSLKEEILNEMARIGFTDDGYEVYIRTDDPGNVPHFHYWDRETKGDKFHSCIRLDCPKYFLHEGKTDTLNHRQKKELVNLLKKSYRDTEKTLWDHLLMEWNDNNEHIKVDETTPMPNYMELSAE